MMGQKDRVRATIPIQVGSNLPSCQREQIAPGKRDGVYEVKQIEGTTVRLQRLTGETVELTGLLKKGKLHVPADTSVRGTLEHLVKIRGARHTRSR